jgi:broad specificity phosphatase PhoE
MITHHITLLRYGESDGNQSGLLQGQTDYPLTAAGIEQTQRLASYWKSMDMKLDPIISSPLLSASQSAEIIASCLNIPPEFDPAWKERDFSRLLGAAIDEIDQRIPPVDFFQPCDPIGGNGESQLDLYIRASQALQKTIRQPAGSYLVVSHGGILNKALYVIMGITPQGQYICTLSLFRNIAYAQFSYNSSSRRWAVPSLNSHHATFHAEGMNSWQ